MRTILHNFSVVHLFIFTIYTLLLFLLFYIFNSTNQNCLSNIPKKELNRNELLKKEIMYNVLPKYPERQNMGECLPIYGKITVFVAYVQESMKT